MFFRGKWLHWHWRPNAWQPQNTQKIKDGCEIFPRIFRIILTAQTLSIGGKGEIRITARWNYELHEWQTTEDRKPIPLYKKPTAAHNQDDWVMWRLSINNVRVGGASLFNTDVHFLAGWMQYTFYNLLEVLWQKKKQLYLVSCVPAIFITINVNNLTHLQRCISIVQYQTTVSMTWWTMNNWVHQCHNHIIKTYNKMFTITLA